MALAYTVETDTGEFFSFRINPARREGEICLGKNAKEEGVSMYEGNERIRGPQGVELIRTRPHDAELEKRRRNLEKRRMAGSGRETGAGAWTRSTRRQQDIRDRTRMERKSGEPRRRETGTGNPGGRPSGRKITSDRRPRRRRPQSPVSILATFACTVLLCVGGIHFVKTSPWFSGGETEEGIQGENQVQEVLGPPAPVVSNDIVERETEPVHENPLIVIDPGHGGTDTGCDRAGVMESEINMEIANRLSGKLKSLGFDTILIREDNTTDVSLEDRVAKAEAAKADMFVSIHQNAYDEDVDDIKGIETYYGKADGSIRLAELVHKSAVETTGAADREIQGTGDLYVLCNTSMPACLIETSFLSSRSDRGNIVTGEYQDRMAEGIAQGINTYFNPKTMYLTFDDGPSADNTTAVLDILKERNIKATFFVVGENVRKHPDVARRIVEEGHTIGIHCNNHDYKELYKSVDSYLEDFQKAYDAVYEVTGVEAKLFRFPGGSVNAYNKAVGTQIIEKMTEKGFIYFDWNASLEDAATKAEPEVLIRNAVSSTLGRKKVVMLAHDVVYNTTQCLEKVIDSFPEYEMKPLTADVEPIQF